MARHGQASPGPGGRDEMICQAAMIRMSASASVSARPWPRRTVGPPAYYRPAGGDRDSRAAALHRKL